MRNSIKEELRIYMNNFIKDLRGEKFSDGHELHQQAFNEDYYIIGYHQAEQWLKKHDVSIICDLITNFLKDN